MTGLSNWCFGIGDDAGIFPVWPKVPYGTGRRAAYVHHWKDAAGVIEHGRTIYAAKWACGGSSPDVLFLSELDDRELCQACAVCKPVVYRCFSESGRLLYVGSTLNPVARMRQHARVTRWWPEVATVVREVFASELAARDGELKAVRSEHPVYNRALCKPRRAA